MIRSEIPYKAQKNPAKNELNSKHYSKLYTALSFISVQRTVAALGKHQAPSSVELSSM